MAWMPCATSACILDRPASTSWPGPSPSSPPNLTCRDGVTYQGGQLIVGLALGVGTSALSVHEVRMLADGELEIATLAALEFEAATADVLARLSNRFKSSTRDFASSPSPPGETCCPRPRGCSESWPASGLRVR